MKKLVSFFISGLFLLVLIQLVACDKTKDPVDNDPIDGTTSGVFNLDKMVIGESGTVTVSRIPRSVAKFKELQEMIGRTPQGVVALYYVAMEMFRVNQRVGETCLALISVEAMRDHENPNSISKSNRQLLKERLANKNTADAIYCPWLTMAYWRGSRPDVVNNTYVVTPPYTLNIEVNERSYQTPAFGGKIMSLRIVSPNAKSGQVQVDVQQPDPNGSYGFFLIQSSANLISTAGVYFPKQNRP